MCPLPSAKTDSVWASRSRSRWFSRSVQGWVSKAGCGITGRCRPLAPGPLAPPACARPACAQSACVLTVVVQQLGQVLDDPVGAVLGQRLGLADPVHADHVAEVARVPGRHPGQRVLEHGRAGGLDAELARRVQVGVGGGLAVQVLLGDRHPVHPELEEVGQPGHLEHLPGVGAGGHHGPVQPGLLDRLQVPDRAVVHLDAVLADLLEQQLVLAVAQAVDGLGGRRVVGRALGQGDAARGQEVPDPVLARLAVDVLVVVVMDVERA